MTPNRLATTFTRRWRSLPPRTLRLRLTIIYGGLFILCGAALLGITYGLVSNRYTAGYVLSVGKGVQAFGFTTRSGAGAVPAPGPGLPPLALGSAHGQLRAAVPVGAAPPPGAAVAAGRILIASAAAQSSAALQTLLIESGVALTIMAVIAMWLGWVVAGRALRPLRAMTAAAREISASNLHRRLALAGPNDELTQLADTFDSLLERLETAFAAQRQFASNVSHELRTPLTLERTLIEVALADPNASAPALRAVCEKVLASGIHQERLIDALLVMSRGQRGLERRETIDLAQVAARTLAAVDSGGLTVETALAPAHTEGDPRLVERLTANLVDNAVRHNCPEGRVDVSTRTVRGRAILTVANTGSPLSPNDVGRLFEPFERLNGARTSDGDGDGLGLGLSIVKAIAQAHAATLTTTLPTAGGLSIEVSFPAAHTSPTPPDDGTPLETAAQPPSGQPTVRLRLTRGHARAWVGLRLWGRRLTGLRYGARDPLTDEVVMGRARPAATQDLTEGRSVAAPTQRQSTTAPLAAVRAWDVIDVRLSDGRVLRARRTDGRGTPVVLLHGLLDSSEGWREIALSTRRPTVAFDLPGFGASDLPTAACISAYAGDIIEAVGSLNLARFTLVGHSLGGAVAAAVAEAIPRRVASLVLLAPAGFGRNALAEAVSVRGVRDVAWTILPFALRTPLALDAAYRLFVTRGAAPTPELLARVRADGRRARAGAALATQAIVSAGRRSSAAAGRRAYYGPVDTLWGDCDRVVPPSHADAVQRAFPQSNLSCWPRMGHHPQRERPAELARLIEQACRGPELDLRATRDGRTPRLRRPRRMAMR